MNSSIFSCLGEMGANGLGPGRLHSSKEPSSRSQMCTYVKLFCFPCVCSDTPTHNGFPLPVRQKNGKKSHYLRIFGLQLISGFFFYHTQMPSSFISTELCHLKHAPKQLRGARLPWTIFPQPSFGTLCCRRKIQVSIFRKFRISYLYEQEFICNSQICIASIAQTTVRRTVHDVITHIVLCFSRSLSVEQRASLCCFRDSYLM